MKVVMTAVRCLLIVEKSTNNVAWVADHTRFNFGQGDNDKFQVTTDTYHYWRCYQRDSAWNPTDSVIDGTLSHTCP